jgi:hypothetical protein
MASNVIAFPRPHRATLRVVPTVLGDTPSDRIVADDADAVSDLLLLLETCPLHDPVTRGLVDVTGRAVVGVVIGKAQRFLTPEQARIAACAMVAENAVAGAVGVAHALVRAADHADPLKIARSAGQLLGDRLGRCASLPVELSGPGAA